MADRKPPYPFDGPTRLSEPDEWPRDYSGYIMWDEREPYERVCGCPLCGAAVTDTEKHVAWHERNKDSS